MNAIAFPPFGKAGQAHTAGALITNNISLRSE